MHIIMKILSCLKSVCCCTVEFSFSFFNPTASGNFLDLRNDQRGGEPEILIWPRFFRVRRVRGLSHNPHQPDIHIPRHAPPTSHTHTLQQSPCGTNTMITGVIFTWEKREEGERERENEENGRQSESQGRRCDPTHDVTLVCQCYILLLFDCISTQLQLKKACWSALASGWHAADWPNLTVVFFYCVSSRWQAGGGCPVPVNCKTTRGPKHVSHWLVNAMLCVTLQKLLGDQQVSGFGLYTLTNLKPLQTF